MFHCNWTNATRYANTEKQDWTEFSWRNNVNDAKFNVIIRLDTCLSNSMNVFPMIITVSTLLSLLQAIKRFNLHVLKTRKLTLFSWGNID